MFHRNLKEHGKEKGATRSAIPRRNEKRLIEEQSTKRLEQQAARAHGAAPCSPRRSQHQLKKQNKSNLLQRGTQQTQQQHAATAYGAPPCGPQRPQRQQENKTNPGFNNAVRASAPSSTAYISTRKNNLQRKQHREGCRGWGIASPLAPTLYYSPSSFPPLNHHARLNGYARVRTPALVIG